MIKPTILYVMTHIITGFKYLGQTTRDLNLYYGSSRVFTEHCKEWSFLVEKEVLLETTDPDELAERGRYYSKLWNELMIQIGQISERRQDYRVVAEPIQDGSMGSMRVGLTILRNIES